MLGNIWLSSAFIVTAIFSASVMFKSYNDVQEAKQIQEHYEIISEIKTLIAKQYNKNPNEITRDEIIAHLPDGENWEKVLLIDRNKDSRLSNKEFVNADGKIQISTDEKLKLLALRAKLKDTVDVSTVNAENGKYTYEVGINNKNEINKDLEIQKTVKKAISYMINEVLYGTKTDYSALLSETIENENKFLNKDKNKDKNEFLNNIYQELRTANEISSNTTLTDAQKEERRKNYFKSKIKEQLLKNETAEETRLYYLMKDVL